MALISPELYDCGLKAIALIKQGREMAKPHPHQQTWPPIFSGSQVIVNWVTPPHWDSGGCPTHYDLLVSAGTNTKAELSVPELGVHLSYRPRDVVALCQILDWGQGTGVGCSRGSGLNRRFSGFVGVRT